MRKEVFLLTGIILVLLSLIIVSGAEQVTNLTSEELIDRSYKCLSNQIEKKKTISLEESIFSTLALGSKEKLEKIIKDEKNLNQDCWPKSNCNVKTTSQMLLAYKRLGLDTETIENWILSKSKNLNDLIWYLEIDISDHTSSSCTLKYDDIQKIININDDMQIIGDPGKCFGISYNGGYWLKIKDCLDKEFEISCDKDFITSLVYQKSSGGTIFVSSESNSGTADGSTIEKVKSKCFGSTNKCNYEDTLWATLSLYQTGNEISTYLPYLKALSEENSKYFPSSFLYLLNAGSEEFDTIVNKQKKDSYWEMIGTPYNKYYDTSLALLSLEDSGQIVLDNAKNYLLDIQTKEGCWNKNNIRDTSFILYSGWAKEVPKTSKGNELPSCQEAGYNCENRISCTDNGGDILYSYDCSGVGGLLLCCSLEVKEKTCTEKRGVICSENQECNGRNIPSSDEGCCVEGDCIEKKVVNICEEIDNGFCRSYCNNDESEKKSSCSNSDEVCCIQKEENPFPKEKSSSSWILIIILIILILLVIIGIIYREKLRVWWHGFREGRKENKRKFPPRGPPGLLPRRPIQRYGLNKPIIGGRPLIRERINPSKIKKSTKDKELEETMRKLKEIAK